MRGTLFKPYNLIVPANGQRVLYHYARFLALLENDQATNVQVKIGPGGPSGEMPKGLAVELPQDKKYSTILFRNPTGVAMAITVAISDGRIYDNRLVLTASAVFHNILDELQGDTAPENWGTEKTVGNAAAVEMIALNADRKGAIIQSKAVNTGKVYIGFDNTVATNKWIAELLPGDAFTIDDYRGDLFARADAVGQLVGWGEW